MSQTQIHINSWRIETAGNAGKQPQGSGKDEAETEKQRKKSKESDKKKGGE